VLFFYPKIKGKEDYQEIFNTKNWKEILIMESGFKFELYEMVFEDCFIHSSRYNNGNLSLSLFGTNPETNQTAHFADITLEQNRRVLGKKEIVVDCKYKPTLIPQLKELKVLKDQTGICVLNNFIYPIYTIDLTRISEIQYCMQELIAA